MRLLWEFLCKFIDCINTWLKKCFLFEKVASKALVIEEVAVNNEEILEHTPEVEEALPEDIKAEIRSGTKQYDLCETQYLAYEDKLKGNVTLKLDPFFQNLDQNLVKISPWSTVPLTNLNNIDKFKADFKKYKTIEELREKIKTKPLCIYAVSKEHDDNGALISDRGLEKAKSEIQELSQYYTVIPITCNVKNELDEKIGKYKSLLSCEISLLLINAHGESNSLMDFNSHTSNKLQNISKESQIILYSCSTAGGIVAQSVAYKIARDNACEVFAAKDSINIMKLNIKNDCNKPKVDKVNAYAYLQPITTCQIRCF